MNNDVVADIFNADKDERRRILYEEMYRMKWETMREKERDDQREKRNLHRPTGFIAAKD
tara:strand:+ start:1187 stop:1363 length:177 start_codon:yes stop_codon:yes gene_type:complete